MSEQIPAHLPPKATAFLAARGISEAAARTAGLETADGSSAAERLGLDAAITGDVVLIPYPGSNYVRARVLDPDANGGVRYYCPRGAEVPVYVPPGTATTGPVVVVESPLKAIALQAHGITAIGLGGIGTTLTPDHELNASWAAVTAGGRDVIVLPDANSRTNAQVARDTARLCRALRTAGCSVKLAELPAEYAGLGPDDVIVRYGVAALETCIAAAGSSDPVERLGTATEKASLLDSLTFLAAVHFGSHADTARVRAAAKKAFGAAALDAAVKDFASGIGESRANGASDDDAELEDFVVHDGKTYQVMANGDPRVVIHGVVQIVAEVVRIDAPGMERTLELAARLPDGTDLGTRTATARELMGAGALVHLFGAALRVDAAPHALLQAMQTVSPKPIPERAVATRLGFIERRGRLAYVTAAGAIGVDGIDAEPPGSLDRYVLPDAVRGLREAALLAMEFFALAPTPAVGVACLAAVALGVVSRFAPADFALLFTGASGRKKSSVAAAALCHFGRFTHKTLPTSFESSRAALELFAHVAGDTVLVIDDYVPRRLDDDIVQKAQLLFQALGNRSARSVLTRGRTLSEDRSPRGFVLASSEVRLDGASVNARVVEVPFNALDLDLGVLLRIQTEAHRLAHVGRALVEWSLIHAPSLEAAVGARVAEYETHYAGLRDASHARLRGQLAQMLTGIVVYLEVLVWRGALSTEEAESAFAVAQRGLLDLADAQRAKQAVTDPTTLFCERLEDLVATRPDLFPEVGGPKLDSSQVLGYRQGHCIHLVPTTAFTYVSRHAGAFMKQSEVYRDLVERGVAARPEQDREYGRKVQVRGVGRIRVVTVDLNALKARARLDTEAPPLPLLPFRRLEPRRDPLALSVLVVSRGHDSYELRDDAGTQCAESIVELRDLLASRDPFHGVVVWADEADPVWGVVPDHAFNARAALRLLGKDVDRLDTTAATPGPSKSTGIDALRAEITACAEDLHAEWMHTALLRIARSAAAYREIGGRGLPLNLTRTVSLRQSLLGISPADSRPSTAARAAGTNDGDGPIAAAVVEHIRATADAAGLEPAAKSRVASLGALIAAHRDGRVPYTLRMLKSVTGRLVSDPDRILNLERGGEVRSCVEAEDGHVLVAADCTAFEFVVLAALAGEDAVFDVMRRGENPHVALARWALGADDLAADVDHRRVGKALFMGLAYGASTQTVAQDLLSAGINVDPSEVGRMQQRVDDALPKLAAYRRRVLKSDEAVRSHLGRRPPAATLASQTKRLNFPVQSTACEVFDAWVLGVIKELEEYGARIVLPFHDELVLEVPVDEIDVVLAVLDRCLLAAFREVFGIEVPAQIKIKTGRTFAFNDA